MSVPVSGGAAWVHPWLRLEVVIRILRTTRTRESAEPFVHEFQRGLKDLGWIEGQNIVIEWRFAGGRAQPLEARSVEDFDSAFSAMATKRAGALLVPGDVMFVTHRVRLADRAAKRRLPAIYPAREYVEAGGLMSYGHFFPELSRRAATYVDKILKGTKPADLPLEQPTKFETVINVKTAKALGLTIPPLLLLRADQVIE